MLTQALRSLKSLVTLPKFNYHFKSFPQDTKEKPGVMAKRLVKCIGERLRKIDPDRWEGVPITFKTNWYNEGGYADIATCTHVHDAIEREFGIEIKDRLFLVTSVDTAFQIISLHHDTI